MRYEVAAPRMRALSTDSLRLLLFGRIVPATFFALLGYLQFNRLVGQVRALPTPPTFATVVAGPVPGALYLAFCAIPVFIYIGRPAPRSRDGRLLARAAGFLGTLMLLVVGVLPQGTVLYVAPSWLGWVSTTLSIVAFGLAVYGLLYLRASLSIIPEARRLVTGGPYRVVRHPLYAAEITAAVAFVLVNPGVVPILVLAPFVATQLMRARFEERLLTSLYPEYEGYAATTRRLVPFLW